MNKTIGMIIECDVDYDSGLCCCRQDYSGLTFLFMKLMEPTDLLRNCGMVKSEHPASEKLRRKKFP